MHRRAAANADSVVPTAAAPTPKLCAKHQATTDGRGSVRCEIGNMRVLE